MLVLTDQICHLILHSVLSSGQVLEEQLKVQKVAVTQKSEACEILLTDITEKTKMGEEKKEMAQTKSVEMEQQNKVRV